jgi:dTDP-4-dehydrorhamnose 3,5-epimerase
MSITRITPLRFVDSRGWFSESWNAARFNGWGVDYDWIQDNHSYSRPAGTLRGLHFQREPAAQTKLVRCLRGRIYDVAVDIRPASPTYKQWVGVELSADNGAQLLIPRGYAHGLLIKSTHLMRPIQTAAWPGMTPRLTSTGRYLLTYPLHAFLIRMQNCLI